MKNKVKTTRVRSVRHQLEHAIVPPNGHWVKVLAFTFNDVDTALGMPFLAHLLKIGVAKLGFFARYTGARPRVECQILTDRSMVTLRRHVMNYRHDFGVGGNRRFKSVKFEKSGGSMAHALMASVIGVLETGAGRLEDADRFLDVVHWGFNMAGFSYAQEAEACARQIQRCLHGLAGWQAAPIAGVKVTLKRGKVSKSHA